MSVVGFDFGNHSCYIAVARQGGIEVITNDYSVHATPSCVSFGDKNRSMGVSARQQLLTKLKSSVINFKHLIGRKYTDPVVQEQRQWIPCEVVALPGDNIGIKVEYLNEQRVFTPEQITAMLFIKLRDTTETSLRQKHEICSVTDCVISVPGYFTDAQRRALLDVSRIAGLNCLKILNETTSVALAYGIYKTDLPPENEKPRHVVFIDVGHAASQACIAAFNKGKLVILGTAWDIGLGGRALDAVLRDKFCQTFKEKYKIDAHSKARPWVRLLDECEKLKKQMSASSISIPINIECFMDDKDVTASMQRAEFEELCAPIWERFKNLLKKLMQDSKMKLSDIDSVELIGGSARIPIIKEIVLDFFQKEPMTTMNMDEATARGCAMQCAILSPKFRVREFSVTDAQPFRIKLTWLSDDNGDLNEMDVFEENHQFPFSKMLTFYRTGPFVLDSAYSLINQIPYPKVEIGRFRVTNVVPNENGESRKVKVKVRINPNGLFSVSSASMVEKVVEQVEAEPEPQPEAMDTNTQPPEPAADTSQHVENGPPTEQNGIENDQIETKETPPSQEEEKPKETKPKIKSINIDLPIEECVTSQMTIQDLDKFKSMEAELMRQDTIEKEKGDAKNAVEEYVYDMRDKLFTIYTQFVTEKDSANFSTVLQTTEDWLYDDGDDVEKKIYLDKLNDLKKLGDPIVERHREFEARKPAFEVFGSALVSTRKAYEMYLRGDEKYEHLEAKDMEKVRKILEEKQNWFDEAMSKQMNRPLTEPPVVFTTQIYAEKECLESVVKPVLTKPKPKPKVEKPKEEQNDTPAEQVDKVAQETEPGSGDNASNMEVD